MATVRDDDDARASAIPRALAALATEGLALDQIEVGGLDPAVAADLWDRLADAPRPRRLDDAEGNPFLLTQLARGAVLAEGTPTVGAAIASRVAALPDEDRRLLEHAALAEHLEPLFG